LNTNSESLPTTDAGSEFQTDGAEHLKNVIRNYHSATLASSGTDFSDIMFV